MPRPLRIEYEGAWYHVMNRGANYQDIFLNDEHRKIFLSYLCDITKKFYVEIHAYCLMSNHYHLLVHTRLANLGKVMRHINGLYTQYFNRLQKRDGALFRGRYKAILIETDTYFLQVSRYIHLNPVTAMICSHPSQYRWSSYLSIINRNDCDWMQKNFTLNMLSKKSSHLTYENYVNEGLDDETKKFYNKKKPGSIFGKKDFINDKINRIKDEDKKVYISDINRTINLPEANIILGAISRYFNISFDDLKKIAPGKKNEAKMIAIFLLRQLCQLTHQKIAEYFPGLNRRSISKILNRCEKLIKSRDYFNHYVKELMKEINNLSGVTI